MKKIMLLLILPTLINPMTPHLKQPRPATSRHNRISRSQGNSPIAHPRILAIREESKQQDNNYNIHAIDLPLALSPEAVHVEEVRAHAVEVRAITKRKIACLVAASAITSAVLTAAVTLTIHFTECKK